MSFLFVLVLSQAESEITIFNSTASTQPVKVLLDITNAQSECTQSVFKSEPVDKTEVPVKIVNEENANTSKQSDITSAVNVNIIGERHTTETISSLRTTTSVDHVDNGTDIPSPITPNTNAAVCEDDNFPSVGVIESTLNNNGETSVAEIEETIATALTSAVCQDDNCLSVGVVDVQSTNNNGETSVVEIVWPDDDALFMGVVDVQTTLNNNYAPSVAQGNEIIGPETVPTEILAYETDDDDDYLFLELEI